VLGQGGKLGGRGLARWQAGRCGWQVGGAKSKAPAFSLSMKTPYNQANNPQTNEAPPKNQTPIESLAQIAFSN
jgi:hypothetical protein